MFFQKALKTNELVRRLQNVSECFFLIESNLPERDYRVALYKYQEDYYLLTDPLVFDHTAAVEAETDDEEALLGVIEACLDSNQYKNVQEELILLDLKLLKNIGDDSLTVIHYFEFAE